MFQWMLSHLGLFLCVLPHDRWLRVGTAMAYNGWTKHLGQTSSWHLVGVTVGGNPVWKERRKCFDSHVFMLHRFLNTVVYVFTYFCKWSITKARVSLLQGGSSAMDSSVEARPSSSLSASAGTKVTTPHCHTTSNTNFSCTACWVRPNK